MRPFRTLALAPSIGMSSLPKMIAKEGVDAQQDLGSGALVEVRVGLPAGAPIEWLPARKLAIAVRA
jgi:hypothetical protein